MLVINFLRRFFYFFGPAPPRIAGVHTDEKTLSYEIFNRGSTRFRRNYTWLFLMRKTLLVTITFAGAVPENVLLGKTLRHGVLAR